MSSELAFWKDWCSGKWPHLGGYEHHARKLLESKALGDRTTAEGRDLTLREFCQNDKRQFRELTSLEGPVVEIGPGMSGQAPFWWWRDDIHIVDPLAEEYAKLGDTWQAKTGLPSWLRVGTTIQKPERYAWGIVICRNCIDHDPNPARLLEAVTALPRSGGMLLLWTELSHPTPAEGHYDTGMTPQAVEQYLAAKGFEIQRMVHAIHEPGYAPGEEFGCIARKTSDGPA
jgi:hypothetical protein